MNCEQAEELFLEGIHGPEAELHLQGCARCREFVREQEFLDEQLRSICSAPAISSDFNRDLRRRIQTERAKGAVEHYPSAVGAVSGILTTLICVLQRPDLTASLSLFGLVSTVIATLAPSVADWLTEELEG